MDEVFYATGVSTIRVSGWVKEVPLSYIDVPCSHLLTQMVLTQSATAARVVTSQRRQRWRRQTERLRILTNNRSGEESRHIVNTLLAESCVKLIALFRQRADAARAILIATPALQITLHLVFAAIVSQQRQRFLHRVIIEGLHSTSDISRRCIC